MAIVRLDRDDRPAMAHHEPVVLNSPSHFSSGTDAGESLLDSLVEQAKWAVDLNIQEGEMPDYSYMFYTKPLKKIDPKAVDIEISR